MQAAALPQVFAETFAAFVQTAAVGSGYAVNELHFSEQRLLTFGLCAACEQSVIIFAVTVPFTAVPSTAFSDVPLHDRQKTAEISAAGSFLPPVFKNTVMKKPI